MTDPKRLLEEDGNELERLLLSAALQARPKPWVRWRAALLFFLATLGTSASAKASVGSFVKLHAGVLRWTLVGLGGGAAALAGAQLLKHQDPALPAQTASARRPEAPALNTGSPPAAVLAPTSADSAEPAPAELDSALPSVPLGTAGSGAASAKRAASNPSLSRELELLDAASKALASGHASGALEKVGVYERAFPRGALAQEALRLRIEATQASGDRAAARRLAREFTRRYPKSAYTQRLRSLLSSDAP